MTVAEQVLAEENIKIVDNTYEYICESCSKKVIGPYKSFLRHPKRFFDLKCSNCKKKQTFLNHYGVEHPSKSPEIQNKMKQTYLNHYGTDNPMKTKEVQQKVKETNLKKYGVENVAQSEEIKKRICSVLKEKYGVEYALQSDTFLKKFEDTMLERYGVNYTFQSKDLKEKVKQTMIDTYGVETPLKSESVKEKYKQTCLKNYGTDNPMKNKNVQQKMKETNTEKFGVPFLQQNEQLKQKSRDTCLSRYGVEVYTQSDEYSKKRVSKFLFSNFRFDSSWELIYYIYCVDHNVPIEVHPCSIPYSVEGKLHYYQPDFLINNDTLVEIKGNHFLNEHKELVNPFNRSNHQKQKDIQKMKCMQENNVLLITSTELQPCVDYVFEKYGKNYLRNFRTN